MFSRAAVNRMWAWFFGRGLVHPVDQMHEANPPSVPSLLERLADDFAAQDYDLRFLAAAIVRSRAYQLSSRIDDPAAAATSASAAPPEDAFAVARLRPLSREQYALAVELALGDEAFAAASEPASRRELYLAAEKRAAAWRAQLDPAGLPHQASATEALFLSNHPTLVQLTSPSGDNLAARLVRIKNDGGSYDDRLIDEAFRTLLGRKPTDEERALIRPTFASHDGASHSGGEASDDRASAVSALLWALVTSAEFRFNH
jgi:hypothetical protein